jgi:uncharacterized membrane protein YgdD (TMEM256/DUF423 family)
MSEVTAATGQASGMSVIAAGAVLIAVGIGIGALGSHALRNVLEPRQLESLHTAVYYQLFNAPGLLLIGLLIRGGLPQFAWPAWIIGFGILFFSGGIYLMLAGAPRLLGFVTPVGGVLLIGGWLQLAWLALAIKKP